MQVALTYILLGEDPYTAIASEGTVRNLCNARRRSQLVTTASWRVGSLDAHMIPTTHLPRFVPDPCPESWRFHYDRCDPVRGT